jgi:hypothetical protein
MSDQKWSETRALIWLERNVETHRLAAVAHDLRVLAPSLAMLLNAVSEHAAQQPGEEPHP